MPPDAVPSDEPNDEEKLEQMPEDTQQTPFRPAGDATYQDNQQQASVSPLQPTDGTQGSSLVTDDQKVVQPDVGDIDDTHPQTDTNMQPEEQYDEGISGAAETGEPNVNDVTTGYRGGGDAQPAEEDYIPEGYHEVGEE